jgi:hypothetical protein
MANIDEKTKSKEPKCVTHIDHCPKCKKGINDYHETKPDDYAKGEDEYATAEAEYERVSDDNVNLEKEEDLLGCRNCPKSLIDCVLKPKKTAGFKTQAKKIYDSHSSCENHDFHCAVCGVGIPNGSGEEIKTVYTWYEAQDVMYQEIDHYKCYRCIKESKTILPHNSIDWHRKQSYLDFLYQRRTKTDMSECEKKSNKRLKQHN